jgi:hypothetical protein
MMGERSSASFANQLTGFHKIPTSWNIDKAWVIRHIFLFHPGVRTSREEASAHTS